MELTSATTVRRPPEEVYAYWRDLENLASFMAHVDEVRAEGTRSHWRVTAPFGRTVEWDAEITEDVPGSGLSWRSWRVRTSRTPGPSGSPRRRGTAARRCT